MYNKVPWKYFLPAFIFLIAITLFPFIYAVILSFFDWFMPESMEFAWVSNYVTLFSFDSTFWPALLRTIYFVGGALLLEHLFGYMIAIMVSGLGRMTNFFTTSFLLPMMIPPVAAGLIWRLMYRPSTGIINYFFQFVGLPTSNWLNSAQTVIPSLIIVDVWQWTPFVFLVLLGGINSIPGQLYEAMELDGGGFKDKLFYLITPMLKPFFVVTLLLRFVWLFTTFDIIMILTKGGPGHSSATLYFMGYLETFTFLKLGQGATWNVIIFLITLSISIIFLTRIYKERQMR